MLLMGENDKSCAPGGQLHGGWVHSCESQKKAYFLRINVLGSRIFG
jgi:hypothetical protein